MNERSWHGFGSINRRLNAADWKAAVAQRTKVQPQQDVQGLVLSAEVSPTDRLVIAEPTQAPLHGEVTVQPTGPQSIDIMPKHNERVAGRWGH